MTVGTGWLRRAVVGALLMALLCAGAGAGAGAAPASATAPSGDGRWERVDAYVRDRLDATGTPGAALAVIEKGRVVHRAGFGEDARGEAVTPRTPFLWGSLAKPVTGMAVLRLVDRGKVELDAPVRTYLPWFRLADRKASARITVRQLLTHTSGIPESATFRISERYDNGPGALTRAVRDLADVTPSAPPGRSYSYSGAGYAVLGALVERVSGRPFGDHLRRTVLDPLGMRDAVATERDFRRERVPAGHRQIFGRPVSYDAPYDTSGTPYGYLGGSVRDLERFVLAEMGGGQVDGRRVLSARSTALSQRGLVDSSADRYGLGWSVGTLKGTGERMVSHDGGLPGYQSMVVMLPDSDRAVLVLQNAYQLLDAKRRNDAAFGAARILSGADPAPVPADTLAVTLPWAVAGTAAVLLLCAAAPALRVLPGPRRRARARSRRRVLTTTSLSVTLALLLGAVVWRALPGAFGGSVPQLLVWMPDVGWSAVAVLVLAPLLAVERLVLAAVDLRRAGRTRAPLPGATD
ncbi:serine hydrolase domain-containing protein [Streptomyces sp. NPDC048172]|uniref:serine hydrolase domain-containing protein n=1 Tax=Streptomyces sp. NPDC048172 TaxID=3365505 RepID=UPI00371E1D76